MKCDPNIRFGTIFELVPTAWQFYDLLTNEVFFQSINQCLIDYLSNQEPAPDIECNNFVGCSTNPSKQDVLNYIKNYYESYQGDCIP